jgi:serine/threonine-protein kinase
VKAFLTEARRAGALNHPNLVQVHDVVTSGSHYLLVMELMTGSLGDLIAQHGAMEESKVVKVLGDISAALAFAESNRLVHRDVKPDNILFGDEGLYKLADLGIATPIADDGLAHQERIFGSPHYVAPEQARGGVIDGRADLYALGATAFHLLAGRPMFEGPTREVIQAHLNKPAPDLKKLVPGLSPGLVQLVGRMLRKNPADRPRSASEVGKMVERLAEGKAIVRPVIRRRIRRR